MAGETAAEQLRAEKAARDAGLRPAVEPFTGKDEDAPHGRTRAGEPKPAPAKRPGRPAAKVDTGPDYREQILGLFQLPAGVLAVAGTRNPVFAADARAVTIYSPTIAESLNDLAHERPEVAAVLDRVLAVGPYGIVLAAVAPLVLQILANHNRIPPGVAGTVPPQQLIQDLLAEVETNPNGQGVTPDGSSSTG